MDNLRIIFPSGSGIKYRTTNEKEKDGKTNKQMVVGDTLKVQEK